jgi:hypothetical protein
VTVHNSHKTGDALDAIEHLIFSNDIFLRSTLFLRLRSLSCSELMFRLFVDFLDKTKAIKAFWHNELFNCLSIIAAASWFKFIHKNTEKYSFNFSLNAQNIFFNFSMTVATNQASTWNTNEKIHSDEMLFK